MIRVPNDIWSQARSGGATRGANGVEMDQKGEIS